MTAKIERRGTSSLDTTPVVLAAVAVLAGAVMLTIDGGTSSARTYADASPAARSWALVAAVSLAAVGVPGWWLRPWDRTYRLCLGIAIAWLAAELAGWAYDPSLVRSTAMVIEVFLVPMLFHMALVVPGHRLRPGIDRTVIIAGYCVAAGVAVLRAVAYDPFLDVDCWRNCTDNAFLVTANDELVDVAERVGLWFVVMTGAFVVVRVGQSVAQRRRSASPTVWWLAVPAALACVVWIGRSVTLLAMAPEDPHDAVFSTGFIIGAISLTLLAAGVAASFIRSLLTWRSMIELVERLESSAHTDVRSALIRSSGDSSLDVAYWLPSLGGYVDQVGRPVTPTTEPVRATLTIERDGEPVGLITHAGTVSDAELEHQIGAAARLMYDNERLRAGLRAQLEELRASRARIVEDGDAARRRIERDLHDGAQQQLLALSFDLRVASRAAESADDVEAGRLVDAASDQIVAALAELRELAHGIFPSVLTHGGLVAAIDSMRDDTDLIIDSDVDHRRYEPPVEMAAYLSVLDSLRSVERQGVERIAVTCRPVSDELVVRISWPGSVEVDTDLVRVQDRVGALGGAVTSDGGGVEVVIPCAS